MSSAHNSVITDTVPRDVRILADALSKLHGPAIIRSESNGYHIYLPSPECLKQDGRKELNSRHLTVNASRYKQTHDYVSKNGVIRDDLKRDFSAVCHKTNTKYRVTDLLNKRKFPPLEQRGIPNVVSSVVSVSSDRSACLVDDGKGNMIPPNPGVVTPITKLPALHPAVEYLTNRGYNLNTLQQQFNCSYCTEELPEDPSKGIYYKKLPANFRDTPQGRIIFYAHVNSIQVGWQARIIEKVSNGIKEYWHPYNNRWVAMEHKNSDGKWEAIKDMEYRSEVYELLWKPSKYKTAFAMARNDVLMGYDAAVYFNKSLGIKKPTVFLAEGPLDAGRLGAGGVAMLGKYLSDQQADLLTRKFKRIVFFSDNDKAGEEAKARVKEVMRSKSAEVLFASVPDQYKDLGEMSSIDAITLAYSYLY